MTTLAQIKALYPDADCEQIQNTQLFIVEYPTYSLLISYLTIVGISMTNSAYFLTDEKYSMTTTKQLNSFAKDYETIQSTESQLQEFLAIWHS